MTLSNADDIGTVDCDGIACSKVMRRARSLLSPTKGNGCISTFGDVCEKTGTLDVAAGNEVVGQAQQNTVALMNLTQRSLYCAPKPDRYSYSSIVAEIVSAFLSLSPRGIYDVASITSRKATL